MSHTIAEDLTTPSSERPSLQVPHVLQYLAVFVPGITSYEEKSYWRFLVLPPNFDVFSIFRVTCSAAAVAAAVANGGGGLVGSSGEVRTPTSAELLSLLSNAVAPGHSTGVQSFSDMVAASVGAGFAAGRGARRASLLEGVPTTRDTSCSAVSRSSPMLGAKGHLPSPSSFRASASG